LEHLQRSNIDNIGYDAYGMGPGDDIDYDVIAEENDQVGIQGDQ
jgi:hypothetical protein